jgi:hypothetical protein
MGSSLQDQFRLSLVVTAFYLTGGASAALAQSPEDAREEAREHAKLNAADMQLVRPGCHGLCLERDAIVFVHGIFGDEDTFKLGDFDWPKNMPVQFGGRTVDIYRIKYDTSLRNWFRNDTATFDDVVYSIYFRMYRNDEGIDVQLSPNRYRSVNFIAHSLGGIVVAALIHTVKSERGHDDRSRFGFVITLGTPVVGATIANAGVLTHLLTGGNDRLLKAMELDNTYLRMMNYWRRAEQTKAQYFGCRKVTLHAAVEGKPLFGLVTIVPPGPVLDSLISFGLTENTDTAIFSDRDHESLVKPANADDAVYKWVNQEISKEFEHGHLSAPKSKRPYFCSTSWLED